MEAILSSCDAFRSVLQSIWTLKIWRCVFKLIILPDFDKDEEISIATMWRTIALINTIFCFSLMVTYRYWKDQFTREAEYVIMEELVTLVPEEGRAKIDGIIERLTAMKWEMEGIWTRPRAQRGYIVSILERKHHEDLESGSILPKRKEGS
ncbi:hypothetical protein EAF04_006641 [Stromatinia cepivora]|nr:hypothetical protein EAF04_006641 [Stromatinia cepivora]